MAAIYKHTARAAAPARPRIGAAVAIEAPPDEDELLAELELELSVALADEPDVVSVEVDLELDEELDAGVDVAALELTAVELPRTALDDAPVAALDGEATMEKLEAEFGGTTTELSPAGIEAAGCWEVTAAAWEVATAG